MEKCGCRVEYTTENEFDDDPKEKITFCPLHSAAGKLLEAAKRCVAANNPIILRQVILELQSVLLDIRESEVTAAESGRGKP